MKKCYGMVLGLLFFLTASGIFLAAPARCGPEEKGREPVSLDYKDAEIAEVLQSLARAFALNIVGSSDVKGKITISLRDVALEEALEAILAVNGLRYLRKGEIIYIMGPKQAGIDKSTIVVPIRFGKASDIARLLEDATSSEGEIKVDEIANSLVITDFKNTLDEIKNLIAELDVPPIQVMIEAKLIDISTSDYANLGITWSGDYTAPGVFKSGRTSSNESIEGGATLAGPSGTLAGGDITLGLVLEHASDVDVTIDALIQDRKAHLIANPSILTLNNKEARIIIGEKVPYKEQTQTTTGTTETTKFVDVGTTLRVTPQVNDEGFILMNIHPEVSSVATILEAGPRITTREADANVMVRDGQTVVIAGLIKNVDERIRSRVPLLGSLPLIGFLFGNKSSDITQKELVVFITPHIIPVQARGKYEVREEVRIPLEKTAEKLMVDKIFERAENLERNEGIESRRKKEMFRLREAIELYQEVVNLFPENDLADDAQWRIAQIYYDNFQEYEQAEKALNALLSRYPGSPYCEEAKIMLKLIETQR